QAGAFLEWPRKVQAPNRAAAGREGYAQTKSGSGLPGAVVAEGCVTAPDTAGIDEQGAADVGEVPERPAEVDAVLDRGDEAPAARERLATVAAHAPLTSECQLKRRHRVPAATRCSAQKERVVRELPCLHVRQQLRLAIDVLPFGGRHVRTQIAPTVAARAEHDDRITDLDACIERDRRGQVVV